MRLLQNTAPCAERRSLIIRTLQNLENTSIRNNTLIYILNKKKKVKKHIMNLLVRVIVVSEKGKKS